MVTVGRDELGLRFELLVQQMTENERAVFERLRLRALDQGDGVAIVLMLLGFVGFPDLHLIRSGKHRASRLWCVLGLFLGGVLLLAVVMQLPLLGGVLIVLAVLGALTIAVVNLLGFQDFLSYEKMRRECLLAEDILARRQTM